MTRAPRAPLTLAAVALCAGGAGAQERTVRVVVSDSGGARVAFAVVQPDGGPRRAADDSGVVRLEAPTGDSLRLVVRRIGFAPFEGWVRRDPVDERYVVTLAPLPHALRTVQVRAPAENRLFRSGFYQRMEDHRKVGTRSAFFTPEDLDLRNPDRVTELLRTVDFLRIYRENFTGGAASYDMANVVRGRGRCTANILLDGQIPPGVLEEVAAEEIPLSSLGPNRARATGGPAVPLDQIVLPGSIAGVEVYQTASSAPVELRVRVRRATCPLIAIWTGPRR